MKKLRKKEALFEIKKFFSDIKNKKPKEIKKIKRLAMHHNIKLGSLRKKFCKKCFSVFPQNAKIRIKNGKKTVKCKICGSIFRWKLK